MPAECRRAGRPTRRPERGRPRLVLDSAVRGERFMRIHSDEFRAMSARVLVVLELTSRLNALPFDDEAGRAAVLAEILGGPLPAGVTVYPPF